MPTCDGVRGCGGLVGVCPEVVVVQQLELVPLLRDVLLEDVGLRELGIACKKVSCISQSRHRKQYQSAKGHKEKKGIGITGSNFRGKSSQSTSRQLREMNAGWCTASERGTPILSTANSVDAMQQRFSGGEPNTFHVVCDPHKEQFSLV